MPRVFFHALEGVQELSSTSERPNRKRLEYDSESDDKIHTVFTRLVASQRSIPAFAPGGVRDLGGGVNTARVVGRTFVGARQRSRSMVILIRHFTPVKKRVARELQHNAAVEAVVVVVVVVTVSRNKLDSSINAGS